jgi:hypothetical protein
MKPIGRLIIWSIVLVWSLFMGITFVSLGIGSLFPQLSDVAGPFVCPHGQIQVTSQSYRVSPVESGQALTYYCVDKQTGVQTELAFWPKHLYAGSIYGLLIFVLVLAIWYFYSRWYASKHSPEARKWMGWIQGGIIVVIVVGITLFNLYPLFRSTSISTPDSTATSVALTFQALTLGKPSAFSSTDKPLSNWNGIPIMPQATAGQHVNDTTYAFRVPVDSGTIESFYSNTLQSQGWNLEDRRWMGMKFAKDKNTVLVTIAPVDDPLCTSPRSPLVTVAPADDLGCFIVTLLVVP